MAGPFVLLAGNPLARVDRDHATELDARIALQALAHSHKVIYVAEIKAEYRTHAVAREVNRDGNVLMLSGPKPA